MPTVVCEKIKFYTEVFWPGQTLQELVVTFVPINPQLSSFFSSDVGTYDETRSDGGFVAEFEKVLESKECMKSGGNISQLDIYSDYTSIETLSHPGELVKVPTKKMLELIRIWNREVKKYLQNPQGYESFRGEL